MKNFKREELEQELIQALAIDGGEVSEARLSGFLRKYLGEDRGAHVRAMISEDLDFFRSLDPASTTYSQTQILSVRRGMAAVAAHRIFAEILSQAKDVLYTLEVIAKYVQKDTNVEIHPAAKIGVPFAIDHGHSTVIGATTTIGRNVFIYHGVTLGASKRKSPSGRRHPRVGDDVFFGNGSQVLGPSIIESNVKLACSVHIRDCYVCKGARIAMDVRLAGVIVPEGVRVLGHNQEQLQRYLVQQGQDAPRWQNLQPFIVED